MGLSNMGQRTGGHHRVWGTAPLLSLPSLPNPSSGPEHKGLGWAEGPMLVPQSWRLPQPLPSF